MKLFHYPFPNFGDAPLNRWLWPQLLPGLLDDDGNCLFVGIGSLLNDQMPRGPLKLVFGSGIGYGHDLSALDASWRVYCVRGPISAQRLGLDPALAITDSAVLVRAVPHAVLPKRFPVSYMPHWGSDAHGNWRHVCALAGIHYIDPLGGVEQVLQDLLQSELLVSEALHGTIVADALRVPWIPVRAYKHILDLKWHDWCQSVGLEFQPVRLAPLYGEASIQARLRRLPGWPRRTTAARLATWLVERPTSWIGGRLYDRLAERNAAAIQQVVQTAKPQLTSDRTIESLTSRMLERLAVLKADHAAGRFSRAQARAAL